MKNRRRTAVNWGNYIQREAMACRDAAGSISQLNTTKIWEFTVLEGKNRTVSHRLVQKLKFFNGWSSHHYVNRSNLGQCRAAIVKFHR